MDYNHRVVGTASRIFGLAIDFLKMGGNHIWVAPAIMGVYLVQLAPDLSPAKKNHGTLLLLMIIAYLIYPCFSGQFFSQHWFPFSFFLVQAAFLCLTVKVEATRAIFRWLPAGVLIICSLALTRPDTLSNIYLLVASRQLPAANNPKEGRVDEMAAFLETRLRPGDTVQPIDWVGGAIHAMLINRVKIATPFIYDEYFYHDLNVPYTQNLRTRFVDDLKATMPRFIIEVYDDGPLTEPSGVNTSGISPNCGRFFRRIISSPRKAKGIGYTN